MIITVDKIQYWVQTPYWSKEGMEFARNLEISRRNKKDLNYWYVKDTHEFIKINNSRLDK